MLFCDRGRHQGGNAGAPGGDGSWWSEESRVGVSDTHVLLLNEYIVELNPAKFNILNQILN